MRTSVKWSETAECVDGVRPPVYGICFNPNGDAVVVTCGTRVLVYDTTTGVILHSLKGHTDTVYCVDYAADGKSFASGGADKTVIVWSNKGDGVLKYQHKDSIQALAYNPAVKQLASIANTDYGIWSPEQPKVGKNSLHSKGLCGSWTQDGQTLAIGLFDGTVLLVTMSTMDNIQIQRSAPVYTLAFSPIRTENGNDMLVVGSWDRRISFYNLQGKPLAKERELLCEPCHISFYGAKGNFMLISGSDHKASLYSRDGTHLINVNEAQDWVWCARQRPRQGQICCATNDGILNLIEISILPVHGIFLDQYVYREKLTDIVVHQLSLDRKMRIPCGEYIRKLASYRDRVAVQLPDRFLIFELFYDDERQMRFQDIANIPKKLQCSILSVTYNAILIAEERRLTMYDFRGNKRREWAMDSSIRYVKVIGGVEGREVVLVGLKGGTVLKIFIDNPFPCTIVKINGAVRCIDLSSSHKKLAVVDEQGLLQVLDLYDKNKVLFTALNVSAVAWNTDYEDMIAYTVNGILNIKTESLPPYQQKIPGAVVSFKTNRVFNLHNTHMIAVEVPHSFALYRYVEKKDFETAYTVARLGVTEGDWKMLGMQAMMHMRLDIARRAFIHIREVKLLELLNRLELEQRRQSTSKDGAGYDVLLRGDILAFQGKYQEAARHFLKAGHENKAIDMFCDLKMWNEAKRVCSNDSHLKELILQQARWSEDSQNYVEAASLYQACGDVGKAIRMMCRSGQVDKLMDMCRSLPKSEVALITECADFFRKHNAIPYALDAYEKVGDARSLVSLHVELCEWREAFAILERNPQLIREVYVPWASWLADNGHFEEALEAYRQAKWPKEAVRLMESLAANSVICRKYRDAAFYFIHLAHEYGVLEDGQKLTEGEWAARIKLSTECVRRADIYYAYSFVHSHITQPFPYDEIALLNVFRYVFAMISSTEIPLNVGRGEVLFALARIANQLNMTRTARVVYEKLQSVVLPVKITEQVDIDSLEIRSKIFSDKEELLDVCYRCQQMVPQLTNPGDRCPNCAHPFIRSFVKFESLPLVEFVLSNDLNDAEAERIILSGAGRKSTESKDNAQSQDNKTWKTETGADVITFADEENIDAMIHQQLSAMGRAGAGSGDPFRAQLAYVTRPGRPNNEYKPFVLNAEMLRHLRREDVYIVKSGFGILPMQNKYYRLLNHDVEILLCPRCQHFFKGDDYEYECLKGQGCPLCRYKMGRPQERTMKKILAEVLDPVQ